MAEVRQRKVVVTEPSKSSNPEPSLSAQAESEDNPGITLLDVARSVVFVLLASAALSYFITRESFVWGIARPNWSRPAVVKSWIVCLPSYHSFPTFLSFSFLISYSAARSEQASFLTIIFYSQDQNNTQMRTSKPSTAPTPTPTSPSSSPSTAQSTMSPPAVATTAPAAPTTSSQAPTHRGPS